MFGKGTDVSDPKADTTYPLKLRVIVDRSSFHIPLNVSIEEKYWKVDKEQIATSCKSIPNVSRINIRMQKQKAEILEALAVLNDNEELAVLSPKEIKVRVLKQDVQTTILMFGEEIIKELKDTGKLGNARVYDTMLRSVRMYLDNKDRPLRKLTYTWLKKYEAWYMGRGNFVNGLGVNMRTLRALLNRAIKRNLVSKDYYPFTQYSIKKEATRKRAISKSDLEKIKTYTPTNLRAERAKDYFLMSFYLMGASFIDLAFLQMKNIQDDRVEYKRRKTGKLHSIKITAPLQAILDKYTTDKSEEDYILPVIKTNDL